jgi:hypothetical protein
MFPIGVNGGASKGKAFFSQSVSDNSAKLCLDGANEDLGLR